MPSTKPRLPARRPLLLTFAAAALVSAVAALALSTGTPLEIDGDATDGAAAGVDWDTASPVIIRDKTLGESGDQIFIQGGSKDDKDISSAGITDNWWRHTTGSVPDKDDLVHAFAKEFPQATTKLLYFGATRVDNSGDATIGFWFLKKKVTDPAGLEFSGVHSTGDILVVADFSKGGGGHTIRIYEWFGNDGDPSTPFPIGQIHASDLVLTKGQTAPTVFCDHGTAFNDNKACASTNSAKVTIPANMQNYVFKLPGGPAKPGDNKFPIGTFFEAAIDLGALGLDPNACYSSVLAMTRSSTSTDAILKDYVLTPFGQCGLSVSKVCKTSVPDASGDFITSKFDVTVTGTGGTLNQAMFQEDITLSPPGAGNATPASFPRCKRTDTGQWLTTDVDTLIAATLPAGTPVTVEVQCDHLTPQLYNNVSASADDGAGGVGAGFTMENTCPPPFNTQIKIDKFCDTVEVISSGGTVQPKVCNRIRVTNLSNQPLKDIAVFDDPDGTQPRAQVTTDSVSGVAVPTTLPIKGHKNTSGDPDDFFEFKHCYTPTTTQGSQTDPKIANFLNDADVSGTGFFDDVTKTDATNKQCDLCPTKP